MTDTLFFSYETAVVISCAVTCALAVGLSIRRKLGWHTGAVLSVFSLVLCMLCSRFFYIAVCSLGGMGFWGPLFPDVPYDYAFGGGVLGFLAALWLAALLCRKSFKDMGEAFAPAGLFAVAALRMAEALSDFGWGDMVNASFLQRYPFAVQNMFGEWCAAVFNLEALCALIILAATALRRFEGRRMITSLLWWAVTQIFCESLRVESIQWGFVRVQQLLSALIVAAILIIGMCRMPAGKRAKAVGSWIIFAACVGLVIFWEYAIDKIPWWPTWVNYAGMAATLVCMGGCAQRMINGRLGGKAEAEV